MNADNETYLDIAKQNLKAATAIQQAYPNDDGMINFVGYHLQQTIELALKHILDINAIKFPKTHEIGDLVELLPEAYTEYVADIKNNSALHQNVWGAKYPYPL